jgi:uncharacterized DUF497 family protein
MKLSYDPLKSNQNETTRNLPFELVATLHWQRAIVEQDTRYPYGEIRMRAFCPNEEGRIFNVIFTMRENEMRIISFRKANARERKFYEKTLNTF